MLEPRCCCLCLLVVLFPRLHLGTETVSKSGCEGDSIELCHFSFDTNFTLVNMYKMDIQIAMLSMANSIITKLYSKEYEEKIFFESDGNVYIRNLSVSDEAKYKIVIKKSESYVCEVQLVVWVAPTTKCRPTIKRVDNVLTVHLEANDCGKPVPSVHWLNHSGIFVEETKAIKLPPGRQSGTYYACIEGDALTCAKSSKLSDYCSFLRVNDGELFPDHAGAGVLKNDNVQEPSSSDKEVAANIGDNTLKGQSHMIIIYIASVCSAILLLLLLLILVYAVHRLFKRKEQPSQDKVKRDNATQYGVEEQPSQDRDERENAAQSDEEEQQSQDRDERENAAQSDEEEQPSQDRDERENAAQSDEEESLPLLQKEGTDEQPSQYHDERENDAESDVKETKL